MERREREDGESAVEKGGVGAKKERGGDKGEW